MCVLDTYLHRMVVFLYVACDETPVVGRDKLLRESRVSQRLIPYLFID